MSPDEQSSKPAIIDIKTLFPEPFSPPITVKEFSSNSIETDFKAFFSPSAVKKDFPARFLSGGEKRRLAVACMIAMDLPILILDEPYANLDYSGVKQVNALLKELKKSGKTIILLTHEIEKCLGLADKFIVLFRGEKVFDGTPEEGLKENLEQWNIKNPLTAYNKLEDLVW